jgi:N-acetyl-gamma-glutamyl-phosphate reductase
MALSSIDLPRLKNVGKTNDNTVTLSGLGRFFFIDCLKLDHRFGSGVPRSRGVKAGVVGGAGYTGVELLRLLVRHPEVELAAVTSRSEAGRAIGDCFPNLRRQISGTFVEPDLKQLASCEVVFFATPNGTAMNLAPALLDSGCRVIDLAADFRLRDPTVWEQWYGADHTCPELLEEAVYGLPEINRAEIAEARLVANPGCYPTAAILGLLPALRGGWVSPDGLIIDAKSGVSGAGRGAAQHLLFAEAADNFRAYGVAGHRHQPEIAQTLEMVSGRDVSLTFIPHLTPMIRGIHATVYARIDRDFEVQAEYEAFYADEPFVDVLPPGSHPETRSVRGGNDCRIAVYRRDDTGLLVVLSVIDNLVKGAAGQAVQNMNLMCGFAEKTGLEQPALLP